MKKKERKLSEKEELRLKEFNELKNSSVNNGYKDKFLTIDIIQANIVSVFLMIPFAILFSYFFIQFNDVSEVSLKIFLDKIFPSYFLFFGGIVIFIVLHELVHGLSWAMFSKNGFKDISFGVMWELLTPYCTCKEPLKKKEYLIGALMPLIIVGFIPSIIGVLIASPILTAIGVIMIGGASGDIMIYYNLLTYKASCEEVLIYDHPTEGGSVIFER